MTFNRFVFWLMMIALLCSATACRRQPSTSGASSETYHDEPVLSDDEFYSAPELIVRATADSVEKEFFTNPDGDPAQNAHITVFNLTILEIYKGTLGPEGSYPEPFQIKIYNGKGLAKDEDFERFLLQIGEEYILGLSYLNSMDDSKCYGDLGGYVIALEKAWTFTMNENGLYENMVKGPNHKEWDIPTLKEKIEYLYRPAEQPEVTPLYTVDDSIKDPAITNAQREQFFELVKEWRVDAMSEFEPGKPMDLEFFKYYCAYFVTEEEKTYVDMGVHYPGSAIERIAKRFGTSYGLKDDDQVFLKSDCLRDLPFAELIQYKEDKMDGKTLVTARCIEYSIPDYYYVDWDQVENLESYPTHKAMILAGKVTGYETYHIFDFSFYTEDGKTPTQFVSFASYYPELIANGKQTLPEFK